MKHVLFLLLSIGILALPALAQEGKGKSVQMKATATVTALDQKTRMITLKTADGKELTTEVSPEVKNLKQVKVGDVLNITYTAAIAFRINPKEAAVTGAATAITTAKPGEKPAATAGNQVTVSATVQAIDLKANTVTFKGPKGNVRTLAVEDPDNQQRLKTLKVGDIVEFTYTEALTVKVEEAPKKK
jgi:hypothetical protein